MWCRHDEPNPSRAVCWALQHPNTRGITWGLPDILPNANIPSAAWTRRFWSQESSRLSILLQLIYCSQTSSSRLYFECRNKFWCWRQMHAWTIRDPDKQGREIEQTCIVLGKTKSLQFRYPCSNQVPVIIGKWVHACQIFRGEAEDCITSIRASLIFCEDQRDGIYRLLHRTWK